jgi:hypothetical protein
MPAAVDGAEFRIGAPDSLTILQECYSSKSGRDRRQRRDQNGLKSFRSFRRGGARRMNID